MVFKKSISFIQGAEAKLGIFLYNNKRLYRKLRLF